MRDLEYSIRNITNKIQVIPSSRSFWVNRTDDGRHYETFLKNGIVGLEINEIPLSKIDEIRKSNSFPNGKVNLERAQEEVQSYFKNFYAKKIRETVDKSQKSNLISQITLRSNQAFHFIFKLKQGDYVVIPSSNSEYIGIGRVEETILNNFEYLPLEKNVVWLGTYKKHDLEPSILKVFNSHLAFYDINKYSDIILRILFDFYFRGEEGNLVLNLGFDGKIPFFDESAFLYSFNELFRTYLEKNNLPFKLEDLSTIVNLNSKGKRKLFGKKETILLAALFLTVGLDGDYKTVSSKNKDIDLVTKSIDFHLKNPEDTIFTQEYLKNSGVKMQVEKQEFFKRILEEINNDFSEIEENGQKMKSYY